MTVGEWIVLVVYLIGIGGLGWVVKTLKDAIEAQNTTIDTQHKAIDDQSKILGDFKNLSEAMKAVIDSASVEKMLTRVKAYEEFVDREKEAAIKAERKKAFVEVTQGVDVIVEEIRSRLETFSKLIMYVPPNARKEVIKTLPIPADSGEEEGAFYEEMAEQAPYLTHPKGEGGLLGFLSSADLAAIDVKALKPAGVLAPGSKIRERLNKKPE